MTTSTDLRRVSLVVNEETGLVLGVFAEVEDAEIEASQLDELHHPVVRTIMRDHVPDRIYALCSRCRAAYNGDMERPLGRVQRLATLPHHTLTPFDCSDDGSGCKGHYAEYCAGCWGGMPEAGKRRCYEATLDTNSYTFDFVLSFSEKSGQWAIVPPSFLHFGNVWSDDGTRDTPSSITPTLGGKPANYAESALLRAHSEIDSAVRWLNSMGGIR